MKNLTFFCLILYFLPGASAQEVAFYPHVETIIQQHCRGCHQKGNIAPMPLTSYEEVAGYGAMIAYVTQTKYMPPWKVAESHFDIEGSREMTDEEIDLIQQWVKAGLPKGEPINKNKQDVYELLELPNPDAVYTMSESFEQYGVYYDQFKVFVVPTHLEEGRYVEAIEFVPGDRRIVRGCSISVDTSDAVEPLDEWDPTYGYFSFGEVGMVPMYSRWYNWHPGKGATYFPKGQALYLPKGAKLLLHIHYGPTGQPLPDSSVIKIRFANERPQQIIHHLPLIHPYNMANDSFFVPAGEVVRYHAKFQLPFDVELRGIYPHSHLLGRKWQVFAVDSSGRQPVQLLRIDDWDFKFKQQYNYKKPVLLSAGTVVHALAEYDNTDANLSNPSNPPRDMAWGKRMFEELFMVYFDLVIPEWGRADFGAQPGAPLMTSKRRTVQLRSSSPGFYTAGLYHFDGSLAKTIIGEPVRLLDGGEVPIDMEGLPYGNYFLALRREYDGQSVVVPFVYVAEDLFD